MKYTHSELVERAYHWLKKTKRCKVALKEWTGGCAREIPDVCGWYRGKYSVVIEVKTSYSDFQKDKQKYFRKKMGYGIGRERYYLAPPGIIPLHEIPQNWGLLEVMPKMIKIVKQAVPFSKTVSSLYNENKILINVLLAVACQTNKELNFFKYSEAVKRGELIPKRKWSRKVRQ